MKEFKHIVAEYKTEEIVLQMKAEIKYLADNNEYKNNK